MLDISVHSLHTLDRLLWTPITLYNLICLGCIGVCLDPHRRRSMVPGFCMCHFHIIRIHFNFIMTNTRNEITTGFLYLQCKNLAIFAEMIFPETCLTTTSAIFCHFFGFHNIFIFSYGIFGAKCNYRWSLISHSFF